MLNGTAEPNKIVRSVFNSIVTTPPQSFGTITSNVPRVRQSELFTPAELMVVLHEKEKEIGLKSTIEGTCFSLRRCRVAMRIMNFYHFLSNRDMLLDGRHLQVRNFGRRHATDCGRAGFAHAISADGEF